jgi:(p)ppGpp synthase/HD superfamily hydrolase
MTIQDARQFAVLAHAGQKRKYTGADYSTHPIRVSEAAEAYGLSNTAVMAAALHDVMEDSPQFAHEIEPRFGTEVACMVRWLTNPSKGSKSSRAKRKEMDRNHLKVAPYEVRVVKAIDRLDNLREMGEADREFRYMYAGESLLLADALLEAGSGSTLEALVEQLKKAAVELP